jgi:hypothetical protein
MGRKPTDPELVASFKAELRELLGKYRACLGVDIDGDTQGMSTDFTVDFSDGPEIVLSPHQSYLAASDLT